MRETEPIAVIGLAGRFPGAADVDTFWENLAAGRDCVSEIPSERWPLAGFFERTAGTPDRSISKWGGFLNDVAGFDPAFFNLSPREADHMDPQQRLFLMEAWRALEDAYRSGKLRSIGVSNFEQSDLENLLETCTVAPHVNQLLVHVGNTPADLIAYCDSRNILVEAYSPIAHGEILKSADVAAIAEHYSVTIPQLCIRYTLQLGTVSLPKTANPDHMRDNAQVDFVISDEDMAVLRAIQFQDYGDHSVFPVYSGK